MDFEQIKTGNGNITTIDLDTIDKITKVRAFDDAELNDLLYQHHKKLLKIAKDRNNSHEVGLFWDLYNYEQEPLKIMGSINGFDMKDNMDVYNLVNSKYMMSVVVMHNHPRNGLFSSQDISTFADYDSIFLMTAICNDGTIYMLRKEENFNPLALHYYYEQGRKLSEQRCYNEQLKKAKKLGINIKDPKNMEKIRKIPTKAYYFGIKNVAKNARKIGLTYRCSVVNKGGR